MLDIGPVMPVVPGPGLPEGLPISRSNNNLDATWHDGRLWLAFRTAPSHFASRHARLHVLVSEDQGRSWSRELTIAPGRDVREPRLVSWHGALLLYWFTAGTKPSRFEPDVIWVQRRTDRGWDPPLAISPPDCVVWRVRPVGNRLGMALYRGAGSLFTAHPIPLTVELWASEDGLSWVPWCDERVEVHRGGSETEFIELEDGTLLAVVRKEGPDGGWGSDLARSEHSRDPLGIATWRLRPDNRKFDSPYLFLDDGRPYLITRRQLAFGGRFDLGWPVVSPQLRTKLDQLAYWLTPKRTAVYAIDPTTLEASWLADLPSAGDTAFAATVPLGEHRHLVFNYSSPIRRGWLPWCVGQLGRTHIYRTTLTVPDRDAPRLG